MRTHRSLGGVDDEDVTGAQWEQVRCILAEVGDGRAPGASCTDRAGDVRPRTRPMEGCPHIDRL